MFLQRRKTMYTREQIEEAVKSKGYRWFENGDYNVNIVGIRNSETGNEVTNKFDDHITVSFKCDGEWEFYCYECTTDPGTHWVENIMRKEGVAEVEIAGRKIKISDKFVQDLKKHSPTNVLSHASKLPYLNFHAPLDNVVGIEHASRLFEAAKHPKSFVSLDTADHFLSEKGVCDYVSDVIAAWFRHYVA